MEKIDAQIEDITLLVKSPKTIRFKVCYDISDREPSSGDLLDIWESEKGKCKFVQPLFPFPRDLLDIFRRGVAEGETFVLFSRESGRACAAIGEFVDTSKSPRCFRLNAWVSEN